MPIEGRVKILNTSLWMIVLPLNLHILRFIFHNFDTETRNVVLLRTVINNFTIQIY